MAKTAISVLRKAMPDYEPAPFNVRRVRYYNVPGFDGCSGCAAEEDTAPGCYAFPVCKSPPTRVFIRATVEAAEQYVIRRVTAALEGNS